MSRDRPRLWLIEEFGLGGIARYTADVADLLHPELGVRVATTNRGPAPGLLAPHEVWFPVGSGSVAGRASGALAGLRRAGRQVRRGDAAWVPLGIRPVFEAALIQTLRDAGVTVVGTVHNRSPHDGPGGDTRVARLAAVCHHVVVHTEELRTWARGAGAKLAEPLPFPPPRITGVAGVHDRASLGAAPGELLVVLVGNLRGYKGVDTLIESLPLLSADAPVRVVLAGLVPRGEDPLALAGEWGVKERVRLLDGYLADGELVDVLTAADAVALPYRRIDHSGMAVLAASLGVPGVASDLPALHEVYGDGAVYVPPGNPPALARALADLPESLPRLSAALAGRVQADPRDAYQRFAHSLRL